MLTLSIFLSPADKTDDELEMTMVCHRPEGLEQLEAQTNFTKQELQILYRGFKNVIYIFNNELLKDQRIQWRAKFRLS